MTVDDDRTAAYRAAHEFNFAHPPGTPVLAWPGTRDQEPLKTRTRHSAWVMPAGDVVVRIEGYPGGIAITHLEHDPTRQPAVPDLEHRAPLCPLCDEEVSSDGDGFTCSDCGASWRHRGDKGTWDNPDATRCLATRGWRDSDDVDQCALAQDHDTGNSLHRPPDGMGFWNDAHQDAITDSWGDRL